MYQITHNHKVQSSCQSKSPGESPDQRPPQTHRRKQKTTTKRRTATRAPNSTLLHLDQHQFIKIHSFLILFSRFWRLDLSRSFLFTNIHSTCFNKLLKKKIHTRKCFTKLKKKIQTRFPCGKARIL